MIVRKFLCVVFSFIFIIFNFIVLAFADNTQPFAQDYEYKSEIIARGYKYSNWEKAGGQLPGGYKAGNSGGTLYWSSGGNNISISVSSPSLGGVIPVSISLGNLSSSSTSYGETIPPSLYGKYVRLWLQWSIQVTDYQEYRRPIGTQTWTKYRTYTSASPYSVDFDIRQA